MKSFIKTLIVLPIFLMSSIGLFAQGSSVKPLANFLEIYKDKNTVISKEVENNTDISFTEKLKVYENRISKLKEEFKAQRKKEYFSKELTNAKRYSCEGVHVRKVTNCNYVVKAPNDKMYAKSEWVEVKGLDQDKSIQIVTEGSSPIIKMTAAGKKKIDVTVFTKFKYKSESIAEMVDKETSELFSNLALK